MATVSVKNNLNSNPNKLVYRGKGCHNRLKGSGTDVSPQLSCGVLAERETASLFC